MMRLPKPIRGDNFSQNRQTMMWCERLAGVVPRFWKNIEMRSYAGTLLLHSASGSLDVSILDKTASSFSSSRSFLLRAQYLNLLLLRLRQTISSRVMIRLRPWVRLTITQSSMFWDAHQWNMPVESNLISGSGRRGKLSSGDNRFDSGLFVICSCLLPFALQ